MIIQADDGRQEIHLVQVFSTAPGKAPGTGHTDDTVFGFTDRKLDECLFDTEQSATYYNKQ